MQELLLTVRNGNGSSERHLSLNIASAQRINKYSRKSIETYDFAKEYYPTMATPTLHLAVTGTEDMQQQADNNDAPTLVEHEAELDMTTPPDTESPVLLREWQQQSLPPVAPAVVVEEPDDATRRSSTYSYPVATFVRDLVRTGMDQISTAYPNIAGQPQSQQQQQDPQQLAQALSVRSEADAEALAEAIRDSRANYGGPRTAVSVPRMSNNDDVFDNENAEFILVDGDLIALPPPTPDHQQQMEDRLRQQRHSERCHHQAVPHPRRVRRGVRKISKFFKRVRRGSGPVYRDEADHAGTITSTSSPDAAATAGTVPASSSSAAAPPEEADPETHSGGRSGTPKHRKNPLRRKRRSWKRKDKDSDEELETGDALLDSPSAASSMVTATTGLETPSYTSSYDSHETAPLRRRRNNNLVDQDPLSPPTSLPPLPPPIPPPQTRGVSHMAPISTRPRVPQMAPIQENEGSRTQSVTASFVGTADEIPDSGWDAGVQAADVAAIAFIESEDLSYWKKDDGSLIPSVLSVVPPDADYKVDKADAPDVESMLMRAAHETTVDLDSSDVPTPVRGPRGKSDGSMDLVPLSTARGVDQESSSTVYNDVLKIVMVAAPGVDKSWLARSLRHSQKRPRKRATLGVDVHSWAPTPVASSSSSSSTDDDEKEETPTAVPIKFMIWDVQGATGSPVDSANFGAHPGTQSLFFSGQSLYLLVWDMGCNNPRPHDFDDDDDDDDDDEEDEEYADPFVREQANRRADHALLADISQRVLSWVDTIARRGPNSAILPVAIFPADMEEKEVKRRCEMMRKALVEHVEKSKEAAPKLLSGADDEILCVNRETRQGIDRLQETILAIGTDTSGSVFDHVGTPVPNGAVQVLELIRRFKEEHKLILLDHLLEAVDDSLDVDTVLKALQFLSNTGEILYFTADDDTLSRYIVLSRKWLVSALSCILRNDLKRELAETRRFMNMQCIYSDHKFTESQVIRSLVSGTMSSCPLLSDNDSKMLWQSMSFMREAADYYSQLSESSTSTPTMFYFLERLLVHAGIFLPLEVLDESSLERSEVFFVPSLLAQADPRDVWTYKTGEGWLATLCHSWLFRDGVPSNLMEHLTVKVLSDLYSLSQDFQGASSHSETPARSKTVPLRHRSLNDFLDVHDTEALGRVKIHQIVCWNSSLLVKVGTVFADHESGELRESFVEVFVAIVDQSANHCVASDAMRASMQRVVVSGKGQVGHHGRKIWKGGYQVILKSVRESLADFSNVDAQVICPECLARSNPRSACTWSWDSLHALAQSGGSVVRCMRGHRVDSNLICGTCAERKAAPPVDPLPHLRGTKRVSEILPSVVLVGLWDAHTQAIRSVGSGFVVDKKLGLVVTAGHVLFSMEGGRSFGLPYMGLPNAKVVIGVIPGDGHTAKFRYFGEIVVDDIHGVDACVVRITTRMKEDVDDEGAGCADQDEHALSLDAIPAEKLRSLKLTSRFELEESVRILGYNQGGEGVYEMGKHVNRCADFAKGYICRTFRAPALDDSSTGSSDSSSHMSFSPRAEIILRCPTISGHSGGPAVNDEGRVIGILSRADPADPYLCYLVPATELKTLVNKAKKLSTRPAALATMASM